MKNHIDKSKFKLLSNDIPEKVHKQAEKIVE